MTPGGPPRGAHPRVLLASAADQLGEPRVVSWCCRLVAGQERADDPDLSWLGGTEEWPLYWRRVWGARGLLYVWSDEAVEAVRQALADPHWRVREMALKVVRARSLQPLDGPAVAALQDDHPRVRAAATRALAVLDR